MLCYKSTPNRLPAYDDLNSEPDEKLASIDYSMVGRLTLNEREQIASTMLAIHNRDRPMVVKKYKDAGYSSGWRLGGEHSDEIIYRIASLQMDRIDLSPVTVDGQKWNMIQVLSKSAERSVPDWVEQMKRIGGLLIGVASQSWRPISLSREWHSMAKECMNG